MHTSLTAPNLLIRLPVYRSLQGTNHEARLGYLCYQAARTRAAGLNTGTDKEYAIHCLRHTYGTYLYEVERDLRMVQQQLGHASISTTQIYAGVSKERTYSAINNMYGVKK